MIQREITEAAWPLIQHSHAVLAHVPAYIGGMRRVGQAVTPGIAETLFGVIKIRLMTCSSRWGFRRETCGNLAL